MHRSYRTTVLFTLAYMTKHSLIHIFIVCSVIVYTTHGILTVIELLYTSVKMPTVIEAPFTLLCICYDPFLAWKLPVHITPVFVQNGEKNICFFPFTLIFRITNTEPKISVFVRSHCSGFVKLIVAFSKTSVLGRSH